ncbi:adenylate/guanylate cyclase domain-containing protein [Sulfitobacter aestuariivivens]|uniref:adenylate/guanylate cyclase domain-containing protein n=1 Tax=Sulfitobacter aestuariivivens TaxID=2766981 RepID=UPI003613C1B2
MIRRRKTLEAAIAAARKTANLSRYLPDRVADTVARQGMDALTTGKQQQATILFADIRSFTTLSESLPPAEIGALLSAFRALILRAVEDHEGIVDKFIGDAVMAVFGVPEERPGHESNGLRCALTIKQGLEYWNTQRATQDLPPIRATIGVHNGTVFAGAVGSARRLEYTVLGDAVNIAARLQEIAKSTASGLVVSDTVHAHSDNAAEWRALAENSIRGRAGKIPLFEYAPA